MSRPQPPVSPGVINKNVNPPPRQIAPNFFYPDSFAIIDGTRQQQYQKYSDQGVADDLKDKKLKERPARSRRSKRRLGTRSALDPLGARKTRSARNRITEEWMYVDSSDEEN